MTATKTVKPVNYTTEQTAELIAGYLADKTDASINALATKFGKTVRSIKAKLAREKVYEAKTYVSKTGEAVTKKDALADAIGAVLRLSENDTESLTKATKPALKAIFEALANSKPIDDEPDFVADAT